MGIDSSTPSLFDQYPEESGAHEPVLSPSEQFRLDNPDFIEPTRIQTEWDPNARQANRQRELGTGGGVADALDGELPTSDVPVAVSKTSKVQVKRRKYPIKESVHGDSERDTGEAPLYHGPEQKLTTEEKNIGKIAIQNMRQEGILRPSKDPRIGE